MMTHSFIKVSQDNLVWSKRERRKPVALVPGDEEPEQPKAAQGAGGGGAPLRTSENGATHKPPPAAAARAPAVSKGSKAATGAVGSSASKVSTGGSNGRSGGGGGSRARQNGRTNSAALQTGSTARAAEEAAGSSGTAPKRARGGGGGGVSGGGGVARVSSSSRGGVSRAAVPAPPSNPLASPHPNAERQDEEAPRPSGGGESRPGKERESRAPPTQRRRESLAQKAVVMVGLEPVQQLLMLGSVPEMADQHVWKGFATVTSGDCEIRASRVEKVIGENAVGRGLFAMRDFAVNEMITVYGGELITLEEAHLRKNKHGSQSHRYLMRISDSDFLVDGWHFASGISEKAGKGGIFLPAEKNATQFSQGCAAMANHDTGYAANATVSFVPLSRAEAFMLYPRVPTLRANRPIGKGEEIRFNYGSALPFHPQTATEQQMEVCRASHTRHFAFPARVTLRPLPHSPICHTAMFHLSLPPPHTRPNPFVSNAQPGRDGDRGAPRVGALAVLARH